ncbi:MAG TPA: beta-propeller domain-containing protein, partial [Kofleriaceae bacterium]|nr:beta-propeller domain-containing protein [Kofleriaceae bacterium]
MRLSSIALVASLASLASLAACNATSQGRSVGQTDFESAPPNSVSGARGDAAGGAGDPAPTAPPPSEPAPPSPTSTPRTVEETDLYRLEGNRLYYLNSYRGLMVFDVADPDHPRLLGRSPIFGDPVDMIVRNGIAVVVIGDWFGRMDDGTPFHGSIVRGLDATDPANIQSIGEAKLGGWVRDDRVVGDVIYAVSEDFGWSYGWDDAAIARPSTWQPAVIVSSVSFANHAIAQVDTIRYDGFAGVFHVTPDAIMLASAGTVGGNVSSHSSLQYIDISDPAGSIVPRGAIDVDGMINGWGADNGRWNLDFADGKTAHVIGQNYDRNYQGGYTLSTVDFANPDQPVLRSTMQVAQQGWSAA